MNAKQQDQGSKPKRSKYPLTKSIIGGEGYKSVKHELIRRLGADASVFLMELVYQLETANERNLVRYPDGDFFEITQDGKARSAVEYFHDIFGYNYKQQNKAKKLLKKHGLIDFRRGSMNGILLFSVNVDAIKALIEDEKQSAGNALTDPRFKRALRKRQPTSCQK